ncbi:hypothetical protein K788_0004149 [Paraburkholderia caribensis MBA4]|uniref:Uncharacterized protein n=1 Tax=Paraburkholderia caribensis MBA4 TaxID=1323664 RepID=A0A0P0R591_9BURK|nr:hypothetical protein K788_0004149 [Paraburkholderia caribensis MBA4]
MTRFAQLTRERLRKHAGRNWDACPKYGGGQEVLPVALYATGGDGISG